MDPAQARRSGDLTEATVTDPANGRTVVTNLRLPGQYDERLLADVGLKGPFYNGQRWYLPQFARYVELDPIAVRGGLNGLYAPDWYGYGNANPVSWVDPNGLAYTDYNVTIGYGGLVVTFGMMTDPATRGSSFFLGGGFGTPGISFAVTASMSNISPGWNVGAGGVAGVGWAGVAGQRGYGAIGRDGSWFSELGGGFGLGYAGTAYYVSEQKIPQLSTLQCSCKPSERW